MRRTSVGAPELPSANPSDDHDVNAAFVSASHVRCFNPVAGDGPESRR